MGGLAAPGVIRWHMKLRNKTVVLSISVSRTTDEAVRAAAKKAGCTVSYLLQELFWASRQGQLFARGRKAASVGGTKA